MKLYEHEAKEIFSSYGIPVPKGELAADADEAGRITERLGAAVLKAQVLEGGRGKAGGVVAVKSPDQAIHEARRIFGLSIKGSSVSKILVEEFKEPQKEMYIGITIYRSSRCPIIMASSEGGIDIEELAKRSSENIRRMLIDPLTGLHDYQARVISHSLDGENAVIVNDMIKKLHRIFVDHDCILAEINPLSLTSEGIFALDAKMIIDDNALFRQKFREIEQDALSDMARKSGMSYVKLDGHIGCIVNGAGLAMATLDMIKQHGGEPANFMDVKAGANEEQIRTALRIVSTNKNVRAIIINIFGGLTKCDEVARGIKEMRSVITIPLVVRLAGTNEKEGRKILEEGGIAMALSSEEATAKVVELGRIDK